MPISKIPTKTVNKSLYKNYLVKAEQFLVTMRNALLEKNMKPDFFTKGKPKKQLSMLKDLRVGLKRNCPINK